jgi:ribonuclease BN (tRNA processing enzyme)
VDVTFVGTSSCMPDIGSDTASFVINGRHLVDTGWCSVLRMRQYGLDPLDLDALILTHLHHDHYMGLVQLLFYTRGRISRQPLKIIGPPPHLGNVVDAAIAFLQIPRFPELGLSHVLMPIGPGQSLDLGDLRLETTASNHVSGKGMPEPALCCRMTERASGATLAFTGDTSFHPPIAAFARGADVLIHDAAHTSAQDAAKIAAMAGVKRLLLIHYPRGQGEQLLHAAQDIFPAARLAVEGSRLVIGSSESDAINAARGSPTTAET